MNIIKTKIKNSNRSKDIEKEMFEASLNTERDIAAKHLKEIADSFSENVIIQNDVTYHRLEKIKEIQIGRISVNWKRPIYEGSKKGKTVYIYPADDLLSPPKKGRVSYETLSLASLLGTFVPFKIVAYMMSVIRGMKTSEASVQRYTESTGQFAIENLEEILESKKAQLILGENEILIGSIDGSSSMINGNNRRSNKKKRKRTKNDIRQEKRLEKILKNVTF